MAQQLCVARSPDAACGAAGEGRRAPSGPCLAGRRGGGAGLLLPLTEAGEIAPFQGCRPVPHTQPWFLGRGQPAWPVAGRGRSRRLPGTGRRGGRRTWFHRGAQSAAGERVARCGSIGWRGCAVRTRSPRCDRTPGGFAGRFPPGLCRCRGCRTRRGARPTLARDPRCRAGARPDFRRHRWLAP